MVTTGRSSVSPDSWLDSPEPDVTVSDALASPYRVKLDVFEGPLDLLLYLIKKEQVSIYDIPIARITEQYLEYLRAMEELDITVASDFLVMAATLIYIKSKMLLPPDPSAGDGDGAGDPRQELVERLLQHQVYKAAAEMLWSRAEREEGVFTRGPLETDDANPEIAATLFDLVMAFQRVMERLKQRRELTIARDEITMAETLVRLRQLIETEERIDVTALMEQARSLRELLTLFLAVLELVKEAMIRLVQTERFGPIIALRCQT